MLLLAQSQTRASVVYQSHFKYLTNYKMSKMHMSKKKHISFIIPEQMFTYVFALNPFEES